MTVLKTTRSHEATKQAQPLSAKEWGFRLGAGAALVGSLLAMVGNLLHPATPVGHPIGVAEAIARSAGWVPIHLLIVAGLLLMFAGLVALCRSVQEGLAGALARYAHVAVIGGITVGLLLVMIDGVAAKHLADVWAAAPPEGAAGCSAAGAGRRVPSISLSPRSSTSSLRVSPIPCSGSLSRSAAFTLAG